MSYAIHCKKCKQEYSGCRCSEGFERKLVGHELKEDADKLEIKTTQEKSAQYWLSVRAQAQKLCAEAINACRAANKKHERSIGFGEIYDENVAEKLVECLAEEAIVAKLKYNEGTPSAYLHDDRASYYWVDIKW